jgi:Ca2+:H+ antiporter
MLMALLLLALVTVLVAVTAEFLVDSINGLVQGGGISTEFVSIILLAIVGNAAGQYYRRRHLNNVSHVGHVEHVTAVTVSVKDKLTLSIGVAVGSSIVSRASLHVVVHSSSIMSSKSHSL